MSLREEMRITSDDVDKRGTSEYGEFSRWWYFDFQNKERTSLSTFIRHTLETIESDEELERLWAQWNIEREN